MGKIMGKRIIGLVLLLATTAFAADEFIDFGDGKLVENPFSEEPALEQITPNNQGAACIDEAEAERRMVAMLIEEGLAPRHAKACLYQMHMAGLMVQEVVFGDEPTAEPYHEFVNKMLDKNVGQDVRVQYHDVINRTKRFLDKNKLTILEDTELLGNYYLSILYNCIDLNMPQKSSR